MGPFVLVGSWVEHTKVEASLVATVELDIQLHNLVMVKGHIPSVAAATVGLDGLDILVVVNLNQSFF